MTHPFDAIIAGKADPDNGIKVGDIVALTYKISICKIYSLFIVEDIERQVCESNYRHRGWYKGSPYPSFIKLKKIGNSKGNKTNGKKTTLSYSVFLKKIDGPTIDNIVNDAIRELTVNSCAMKDLINKYDTKNITSP